MARHTNSVYSNIAESIRSKITRGEYAVGTLLEPERKLMEIYGVERTTVRRALEILVSDGLIEKRTGLGTFITDGKCIPVSDSGKQKGFLQNVPLKIKVSVKPILTKDIFRASDVICEHITSALGLKRIAFIGTDFVCYAALIASLSKENLYSTELFIHTDHKYDVTNAFVRLWKNVGSAKPEAIITSTSDEASYIAEYAESMRVSIPSQLSVISFETNAGSGITGCIFDDKSIKSMLNESYLSSEMNILIPPVLFIGESSGKQAKNSSSSVRKMSDYLL